MLTKPLELYKSFSNNGIIPININCPKVVYSSRLRKGHKKIRGFSVTQITEGVYKLEKNKIVLYINPEIVNLNGSYNNYGFRGLTRFFSVIIIHELSHWCTGLMDEMGHNTDSWNKLINSIVYRTTSYSRYPNESFYRRDIINDKNN